MLHSSLLIVHKSWVTAQGSWFTFHSSFGSLLVSSALPKPKQQRHTFTWFTSAPVQVAHESFRENSLLIQNLVQTIVVIQYSLFQNSLAR